MQWNLGEPPGGGDSSDWEASASLLALVFGWEGRIKAAASVLSYYWGFFK